MMNLRSRQYARWCQIPEGDAIFAERSWGTDGVLWLPGKTFTEHSDEQPDRVQLRNNPASN